jgi:hypothetical protein
VDAAVVHGNLLVAAEPGCTGNLEATNVTAFITGAEGKAVHELRRAVDGCHFGEDRVQALVVLSNATKP